MSGKLFIQIVLLIIIAALVITSVRIGTKCLYKAYKNCQIRSGAVQK